jgi:hypothetical protein
MEMALALWFPVTRVRRKEFPAAVVREPWRCHPREGLNPAWEAPVVAKVLDMALAPAAGSPAKEAVQEKKVAGADRTRMQRQEFLLIPDRVEQALESTELRPCLVFR